MNRYMITVLAISVSLTCFAKEEKALMMDPNKIQMNSYVYKTLPPDLLRRIKATTDVFETVDGTTFDKAVDLYKRDYDPESNLVIWEEMARVYQEFCKTRCSSHTEKMDVYRTLLLRSMFSESETLSRLQIKVISRNEAKNIISQYKLPAKPIDVILK